MRCNCETSDGWSARKIGFVASFGTLCLGINILLNCRGFQEQLSLDKESALALATELQTQGCIEPLETGLCTSPKKERNWFVLPRPVRSGVRTR
jgi:hypothetical protein